MKTRPWTVAETEHLKRAYAAEPGHAFDLVRLSAELGRTRYAVCLKARRLGLTRKSRPGPVRSRAKYATAEERRAAISVSARRQRIRAKGHPRGATGMKRTPEHTEKLLAAAKRFRETATPERRAAVTGRILETRIKRYGTAGPPLRGTKAFSRAKSGKREDLNLYVRSTWEANYARYLNLLKARGLIVSWAYEARTFRFDGISRGCMTYTPDFEVTRADGTVEYHEVKGWMDDKSRVRLRRLKKYHPTVKLVLVDKVAYRDIDRKLSALISHWEGR